MGDWNTWTSKFNRFVRIPFFTERELASLYKSIIAGVSVTKSEDLARYDVDIYGSTIAIYLFTTTEFSLIRISKRPDTFEIELSVDRQYSKFKYKNYYIKDSSDTENISNMINDINEQIRTF